MNVPKKYISFNVYRMKTYVELGLAALLAVLVYEKPNFLLGIVRSTLGKVIMIVIVGLLAKRFGLNSGLLAAIIMIVLLETTKEGFKGASEALLAEGEVLGSASIKNIGCGKKGCKKDTDCAACKKTYKNKVDEDGNPIRCDCNSTCVKGKCKCGCDVKKCKKCKKCKKSKKSKVIEQYVNVNVPFSPAPFPVTGTDQITLDRQIKQNAIIATNSASQQANGQTNNGGGIAF